VEQQQAAASSSLLNWLLEVFDPMIAMATQIATLVIQIKVIQYCMESSILLAITILAISSHLLIYISILLTYRVFKTSFNSQKAISLIFCCILAKKMREKKLRYRFKYLTLVINIGVAIGVSVISSSQI
jgi:hypothetical protein